MGYGSSAASWSAVLKTVDEATFAEFVARLHHIPAVTDTTTLFDMAHCHIPVPLRATRYVEQCLDFSAGEFTLYAIVGSARSVRLQRQLIRNLLDAKSLLAEMSFDDAARFVSAVYLPTGMDGADLPSYAADIVAQLGIPRCLETFR